MVKLLEKKALSLVEIMVAVVIFIFLIAALYAGLSAGNMSWGTHENAVSSKREVRKVLTRITRELHHAENLAITQDLTSSRIDFTRPGIGSLYYEWGANLPIPTQVIRGDATTSQIIATHISSLQFTDLGNSIDIEITSINSRAGGEAVSFSLRGKAVYR